MSFTNDPASSVNQLPISIEIPEDSKDLQEILQILLRRITQVVNTKEGGLYTLQELINFQQYFTPGNPQQFRTVYRTVVDFGVLPNGTTLVPATKSVPHGINFNSQVSFTHIYATATDHNALNAIPIPYTEAVVAGANQHVQLYLDATNVNIVTSTIYSQYTTCYVVLEYVKVT